MAMSPSMTALMPWRWQISRATPEVTGVSGGRLMNASVSRTRWSATTLRKGDSSSLTASACLSVPSNIESPVVLPKSAIRILSLSASAWLGSRSCQ